MKERSIALTNGRIFTADDENRYADSMIIEKGVIKWVGMKEEMPYTDIPCKDLNGKRVLPGFVDAHMHLGMLAEQINQIACLPPKINSIEDIIEEIKKVREEQGPNEWIEGWGYDEGKFSERRGITRYDLDMGCDDAPVSITRSCSHIRCVNSKALELAGIDRNTPDPPGGEIEKDETGEPTGILRENARDLVTKVMPKFTDESISRNMVEVGKLLASQGITSITDMGSLEGADYYDNIIRATEYGLKQRVALYYIWDYFSQKEDFSLKRDHVDREHRIRIAGLKLICDGSVSGRTAWMDKPYAGSMDEYGISVCSDELIDSAVEFCKSNGCQLAVHAMGTRAVERAVDRIYDENPWTDDSVPFARVEHVTDPEEGSINKAAEKGIFFVTQPNFLYAEIESYVNNLGIDRLRKTYPVNHMLKRGVKMAFSTDAPATSWAVPSDPMPCIKFAVTRKAYDGTDCGQDETVGIETAIELYTRCSAEAAGFKNTGMLKEGYYGDFIIMDRDIMTIASEDIDKVNIQETYIEGECVYKR